MRIIRVQSCCWGFNLRTGTMIVGTVDFLGALVTVVVTSIAAVNAHYSNWWEDYYHKPMSELRPMYITVAVFSSILLIFDCLLIFGVSQIKPRLVLPWMFYAIVSLLLNCICAIIYSVHSFSYYYDSSGYLGITWAIFYLVLKLYFLLVVWSHYHQMIRGPGTTLNHGVHVTMYPTVSIGPQPFPNAPQTYPNVQTQYPNVQMQYPNQPQPYPNVQVLQTFPNPQQPYPNPQQTYPNSQQPYSNPQQTCPNSQQPFSIPQQPNPNTQQPYPNPEPLPSVESIKRDV